MSNNYILENSIYLFTLPVTGGCNTAIGGQGQSGYVCGLSAVDPRPNCGLAPTLSSRMLPRCPGWAWLKRSCLVPMVRSRVWAQLRAERRYRLLSCPESAAAAAAEQQQQQSSRAAEQQSSSSSSAATAALNQLPKRGQQQKQQQTVADKRAKYCILYNVVHCKLKNSCPK